MYFLLSLITTTLIGYYLPEWMYELSWKELIKLTDKDSASSIISDALKDLGFTAENSVELATKKIVTLILIIIAIFIGMLILTKILKNLINKK